LWLPSVAVAYSQYTKFTLVKKHSYTDFKLFSVGTQSVIEKPKIPGAQPGGAPLPAAPAPAAAPVPNDKPAEPPTPKR
jgi:hypothetical protein